MGGAIERLGEKLALSRSIRVKPHVRRQGTKLIPVVGYDRDARSLLQKALVDYKKDRNLSERDKVDAMVSVLPNARQVDYTQAPFFDDLNRAMGVDPYETQGYEYAAVRDRFFEGLPLRSVPLDRLVVTQKSVNQERVRGLLAGAPGSDKALHVVRYRGETWVMNGHHRLAADVLSGKRSVKARVLDFDGEKEWPFTGLSAVDALALAYIKPHVRRINGKLVQVGGYERDDGPGAGTAVQALKGKVHVLESGKGDKGTLDDTEYKAHTAKLESTINEAFARKKGEEGPKPTEVDHATVVGTDSRGDPIFKWSKERTKKHIEIANRLYDEKFKDVPSEGKALMTGGLGGSGKSSILKGKDDSGESWLPDFDPEKFGVIDPDGIKEVLIEEGMAPEMPGFSPLESASLIHEESSHIAKLLANKAYAERKNLVWDITMSSTASTQDRIKDLRNAGYESVRGVFADIPVEESVKRALGRHRRGLEEWRTGKKDSLGGRYVPPRIIRKNARSEASSANRMVFDELRKKNFFDAWDLFDTSKEPTTRVDGFTPPKRESKTSK